MMKSFKKIFLNDRAILAVILVNAVVIYLQVSGIDYFLLKVIDNLCTLIFLIEMIVKHQVYGFRGYWKNGWNKMDGILVILSLPSLIDFLAPSIAGNLSVLLVLRVLRVLRFFRVLHFFPKFPKVVHGFKVAMRESYGVFLSFFVTIIVFGLLNCSLFQEADPEHFSSPLQSIYSVFQICTIEGWYEIPNTIADYYGHYKIIPHLVRLYFTFLLLMGGIIGMSFLNSIFVDAMAEDNNDDVKDMLRDMQKDIDEIKKDLKKSDPNAE